MQNQSVLQSLCSVIQRGDLIMAAAPMIRVKDVTQFCHVITSLFITHVIVQLTNVIIYFTKVLSFK